ncbi:unnamed protein product [Didymodactylos carnosus]|uniref:Dynamin N-terminal domain-containing protein n=1 Tax=Didymodactylos carnosus TaxID=1234261 RepID=A0A814KGQ4_9BILA|nr:unnamed protein product [Didymodactylos carnosus]CAF1052361.1 unnamed protein product [Didymodactylos carnosus]CAF3665433.1 unnamed protein product [Didymodactylos carnosus]CAF3821784.1 unnamed protein product [Didymodactylos carnosus]
MKETLKRLKDLNAKEWHIICISGLEKCGKSTYINVLLDDGIPLAAAERCTQICTVLKPLVRDDLDLFTIVRFYDDQGFERYFGQITRKPDEQEDEYQSRQRKSKNYELLDVPGFDSSIKEHRGVAFKVIQSVDAFLYVTDGQRPSLQNDQIILLNEIQHDRKSL